MIKLDSTNKREKSSNKFLLYIFAKKLYNIVEERSIKLADKFRGDWKELNREINDMIRQ